MYSSPASKYSVLPEKMPKIVRMFGNAMALTNNNKKKKQNYLKKRKRDECSVNILYVWLSSDRQPELHTSIKKISKSLVLNSFENCFSHCWRSRGAAAIYWVRWSNYNNKNSHSFRYCTAAHVRGNKANKKKTKIFAEIECIFCFCPSPNDFLWIMSTRYGDLGNGVVRLLCVCLALCYRWSNWEWRWLLHQVFGHPY